MTIPPPPLKPAAMKRSVTDPPGAPVTLSRCHVSENGERDNLTPGVTPLSRSQTASDLQEYPKRDNVTGSPIAGVRTGEWLDGRRFPPVEYVVPRIVAEGFTLLVGPPKIGKSWWTLALVLAAGSGDRFLRQQLDQRPVLHLALEDGDRRLQERSRQLRGASPLPRAWQYATEIPAGVSVLEMIEAWISTLAPDAKPLVVVDTLGRVRPPQRPTESMYDYDYRIGAALKRAADARPGAAIVVVHHDRKADSGDWVETVSGSNGLTGSADAVVLLRRDRGAAEGLLQITGRDVPDGEFALTFEDGFWDLAGDDLTTAGERAGSVKAGMGKGDTVTKVVLHLAVNPGSTPKQIADGLGLAATTVRQTLSRLAREGRVAHDPSTRSYSLPTTEIGEIA